MQVDHVSGPPKPQIPDAETSNRRSVATTEETLKTPDNSGNGSHPGQRVRKRTVLRAAGILILVIGAVIGFRYFLHSLTHESTDDAFIEGHVIQISPKVAGHVLQVHVEDNQEVKKGHILLELDPRDYQTRVNESRAAVDVALAKRRAAQLNVELTSATSTAGASQASSGVDIARSSFEAARAQAAAAEKKVEQVAAQVRAARANADQALAQAQAAEAEMARVEADLRRTQQLYANKLVSREEYEHAVASGRSSAAQYQAARQRASSTDAQVAEAQSAERTAQEELNQAKAQLASSAAQIAQARGKFAEANVSPERIATSLADLETAKAQVEQSKAALEQAELDLSYTQVRAPEAGRVTRKAVEPGMYLQPGQSVMAIVPPDVWVVANFKETQLSKMEPGQKVTIEADAHPGRVFQGHVDSIQAGAGARFSLLPPENATGNFVKVVQRIPVKIVFDRPPPAYLLTPGMSVRPEVRLK